MLMREDKYRTNREENNRSLKKYCFVRKHTHCVCGLRKTLFLCPKRTVFGCSADEFIVLNARMWVERSSAYIIVFDCGNFRSAEFWFLMSVWMSNRSYGWLRNWVESTVPRKDSQCKFCSCQGQAINKRIISLIQFMSWCKCCCCSMGRHIRMHLNAQSLPPITWPNNNL